MKTGTIILVLLLIIAFNVYSQSSGAIIPGEAPEATLTDSLWEEGEYVAVEYGQVYTHELYVHGPTSYLPRFGIRADHIVQPTDFMMFFERGSNVTAPNPWDNEGRILWFINESATDTVNIGAPDAIIGQVNPLPLLPQHTLAVVSDSSYWHTLLLLDHTP